jgi:hypothetical protein
LLQLKSATAEIHEDSSSALAPLLSEFADIFAEPNGLSPQRLQDHRIPLMSGNASTNVRPYRYPHF